jgi:hypothetical protein
MCYKILNQLKQFEYLGKNILDNGTLLIAKAPHIAPYSWLHCIYSPLSSQDINLIENKIGEIPNEYKNFLLVSNGLGVFNTTLSLYGLRRNYKRTIDDVWQPFNIITPNTLEKPSDSNDDIFIIGSYDWDGSYIYVDKKSNKTHLCNRYSVTSLFEWRSFNDMLEKEIMRLITLFDKNGKEIDENKSTLPA